MASSCTDISIPAAPEAGQSIVFFLIITTIFAYIRYHTNSIPDNENYLNDINNVENISKNNFTSLFIYILLILIGNYFINLNISTIICGGDPQFYETFLITVIPWTLIFILLIILLVMFPGWLSPFSNTIGYFFANMMGLNDLMNSILKPTAELKSGTVPKPGSPEALLQYNLTQIYGDKALLINEITEENFITFWERLKNGGLLNIPFINKMKKENIYLQNQLFNLVVVKNTVAQYIWFVLTGLLVTSIGYNYLVTNGCNANIDQLENTHNAYKQLVKEKMNTSNS